MYKYYFICNFELMHTISTLCILTAGFSLPQGGRNFKVKTKIVAGYSMSLVLFDLL